MRMTPAQQYRRNKLAELAAQKKDDSPYGAAVDNEYSLMRARMVEHQRSLKRIQSKEGKGRLKAIALKDFEAWNDGVLEHGVGDADEIFVTCLIWSIDAGEYERALKMAQYAITHKLEAPDAFNRTLPVVIMDEFSNAAKARKLGEQTADLLHDVINMTPEIDAPDELRAKLLKMHAFALIGRLESAEINEAMLTPETVVIALQELNRAFELDTNAGVVKEQRKLESILKKIEEAQEPASPSPDENAHKEDEVKEDIPKTPEETPKEASEEAPAGETKEETEHAENDNEPIKPTETTAPVEPADLVPPAPPAAHVPETSKKPTAPKKATGKNSPSKA